MLDVNRTLWTFSFNTISINQSINLSIYLWYCHLLFMQKYTYICWRHTDAMITDAEWLLYKYFTSHFIARVRKGCSRVACERELEIEHNCNILTPLLWPSCCVFLVLLILGSTPSGFPRATSVGCGFPYHTSSLTVWNPAGNCSGSSNSTQLYNRSTPTRSLKSNV